MVWLIPAAVIIAVNVYVVFGNVFDFFNDIRKRNKHDS